MGITGRSGNNSSTRRLTVTLVLAAAVLSMLLAVLVRLPHYISTEDEIPPEIWKDEEGLLYFTEMDSYYHVRMADEITENGVFGTPAGEGGKMTDLNSFAPEGRSAEYHRGIVSVSLFVWRFLNLFCTVSLHRVDFYLSCLFGALTALAAFLLGCQAAGPAAALAAGVITSCAPAFVERSMAGIFDTDMIQLVLAILLMMLMIQILSASSVKKAVVCGLAFAVTAVVYGQCWAVFYLMYVFIAVIGGALYLLLRLAGGLLRKEKGWILRHLKSAPHTGFLAAVIMTVLLIGIVKGPSYIFSFFGSVSSASGDMVGGNLPNMHGSVMELQPAAFAQGSVLDWILGWRRGRQMTVIAGIGGLLVLVCAVLCMIWLVFGILSKAAGAAGHSGSEEPENEALKGSVYSHPGVWLCVCGTWFVMCSIAISFGERFTEHLAPPAAILAGILIGMLTGRISSRKGRSSPGRRLTALLTAGLGLVIIAIPVRSAYEVGSVNRGFVSDASAHAMDWIRDHAQAQGAVIASWWDMGYFYSSHSGHPVLWDGGSMNTPRALLLGKALVSDDPAFSNAMLKMLTTTGNQAIDRLADTLGMEQAVEALDRLILQDTDKTVGILTAEYGIQREQAEELEALIHPEEVREAYLVLDMWMMKILGWIEYYARWDFTGEMKEPEATPYNLMPDGSGNMGTDDPAVRSFFETRQKETIWQLYLEQDSKDLCSSYFTQVFNEYDGINMVQVWHIHP